MIAEEKRDDQPRADLAVTPRYRSAGKEIFHLRWERGIPRFVIHERHERIVKRTLWTVTAIGILTSVVSLPWWGGLSLAVGLFLLEQLFERIIFVFTSMYVQPLPEFEYDSSKWTGMSYVVGAQRQPNEPNAVGLVFSDATYARQFFELVKSWNYGADDDPDNNVQLSFIVDEDRYYVFLYPNLTRPTVREALAKFEQEARQHEAPNKEHQPIVISLIICKWFHTGSGFWLGDFVEAQLPNAPFWLLPLVPFKNEFLTSFTDLAPLTKWHFKYKNASELTEQDFEFVHLRMRPEHTAGD